MIIWADYPCMTYKYNIKKNVYLCDSVCLLILQTCNFLRSFTDSDTLSVLSAKLDSAEQNLIAAKLDEKLQLINDARLSQVCNINHWRLFGEKTNHLIFD